MHDVLDDMTHNVNGYRSYATDAMYSIYAMQTSLFSKSILSGDIHQSPTWFREPDARLHRRP